jgi:putative copper export protein
MEEASNATLGLVARTLRINSRSRAVETVCCTAAKVSGCSGKLFQDSPTDLLSPAVWWVGLSYRSGTVVQVSDMDLWVFASAVLLLHDISARCILQRGMFRAA